MLGWSFTRWLSKNPKQSSWIARWFKKTDKKPLNQSTLFKIRLLLFSFGVKRMDERTQRTVCTVCVCGRVLAFEKQVCHNSADPVFSGGITGWGTELAAGAAEAATAAQVTQNYSKLKLSTGLDGKRLCLWSHFRLSTKRHRCLAQGHECRRTLAERKLVPIWTASNFIFQRPHILFLHRLPTNMNRSLFVCLVFFAVMNAVLSPTEVSLLNKDFARLDVIC